MAHPWHIVPVWIWVFTSAMSQKSFTTLENKVTLYNHGGGLVWHAWIKLKTGEWWEQIGLLRLYSSHQLSDNLRYLSLLGINLAHHIRHQKHTDKNCHWLGLRHKKMVVPAQHMLVDPLADQSSSDLSTPLEAQDIYLSKKSCQQEPFTFYSYKENSRLCYGLIR